MNRALHPRGPGARGCGVGDCKNARANDPNKTAPGLGGCGIADRDPDAAPNCVDNRPKAVNADQLDRNDNGVGDTCDPVCGASLFGARMTGLIPLLLLTLLDLKGAQRR